MKKILLIIVLLFLTNTTQAQKGLNLFYVFGPTIYMPLQELDSIKIVDTLSFGVIYQGGIVFYVDETGEHGLVATSYDIGKEVWGIARPPATGATGDGIGAGVANTNLIIANNDGINAAKLCAELTEGGYTDWYLPSKFELNLFWTNFAQYPHYWWFPDGEYWSSTETDYNHAWFQDLRYGTQSSSFTKQSRFKVLAIRAF